MTGIISLVRHILDKHLAKKKIVCLAFVDLEKAFDMVKRAATGRTRFKDETGLYEDDQMNMRCIPQISDACDDREQSGG